MFDNFICDSNWFFVPFILKQNTGIRKLFLCSLILDLPAHNSIHIQAFKDFLCVSDVKLIEIHSPQIRNASEMVWMIEVENESWFERFNWHNKMLWPCSLMCTIYTMLRFRTRVIHNWKSIFIFKGKILSNGFPYHFGFIFLFTARTHTQINI